MTISNDLIDSRYRILKNIGSGAMGSVFLVHDEKLDKLWAAKLVKDISSNELLALKSVSHPAFPRLVDSVREEDHIWLIMDYMEGISLSKYMKTSRFGKKTFESIAKQLATAIDYLHTLTPSMLYLDCKPDNIIIDRNGNLHMIDLGSIYLVNESNPGRISGTAGFASPEQRLGKALDARSDIYSYGMTLKAIMPGPDTSKLLMSIIKKSTSANPAGRFQSMHEIKECLSHPSHLRILSIKALAYRCLLYILYTALTLFTILSYRTYSLCGSQLFLILATTLFMTLLSVIKKEDLQSVSTNWTCHRDVYLSRGLRSLPTILLIVFSAILLFGTSANATPLHAYSQDSYRVTLYTAKNEKILYYGQQLKINPDGSATLTIPVSSLTPDSIPAKVELLRKY